jgi:kynureninase
VLEQWKTLGVDGWLGADPPWFTLGEDLGALVAPLIGAESAAVVITGTTTVNQHALTATFYQPEERRRKIVATALDFPSDVYALQSLIRLHGGDPRRDLVFVPSRDGRTIAEEDVIAALTDDVALALLPAVLYRSGQLLDIPRLAAAARARDVPLGFDCAHSIGAVPHHFDEWGVDWAFWCSYKYLNAGPGATGGLYVNRRHWGTAPGLAGWWGYEKSRQFDMVHDWEGAAGAAAWQISTPPAARHGAPPWVAPPLPRSGHRHAACEVAGADGLSGAAPRGDRAHRAALLFHRRHPAGPTATWRPPRRRA